MNSPLPFIHVATFAVCIAHACGFLFCPGTRYSSQKRVIIRFPLLHVALRKYASPFFPAFHWFRRSRLLVSYSLIRFPFYQKTHTPYISKSLKLPLDYSYRHEIAFQSLSRYHLSFSELGHLKRPFKCILAYFDILKWVFDIFRKPFAPFSVFWKIYFLALLTMAPPVYRSLCSPILPAVVC